MGTYFLACGCSVASSMFGAHEILHIYTCLSHATIPRIQQILVELVKAIKEENVSTQNKT